MAPAGADRRCPELGLGPHGYQRIGAVDAGVMDSNRSRDGRDGKQHCGDNGEDAGHGHSIVRARTGMARSARCKRPADVVDELDPRAASSEDAELFITVCFVVGRVCVLTKLKNDSLVAAGG